MRIRCNVDRIGLTVWFSSELIRTTLCTSRGTERKALSSRSSLRGTIEGIGSKSNEARFGRRWKFGATKASGVCRFTSHLESSHLLVTPASWPTYRDRHITNVTLCSRACIFTDRLLCMHRTHLYPRIYVYTCACCTSRANVSSCKIGFSFPTILSDLKTK